MAIIVQIGSFDQARYPDILKYHRERIHGSAVQYVFVDTVEQVQELMRRIAQYIPEPDQPPVFVIPAGCIGAKEAFAALVTGISPMNY